MQCRDYRYARQCVSTTIKNLYTTINAFSRYIFYTQLKVLFLTSSKKRAFMCLSAVR
jgi:hypothetical protein